MSNFFDQADHNLMGLCLIGAPKQLNTGRGGKSRKQASQLLLNMLPRRAQAGFPVILPAFLFGITVFPWAKKGFLSKRSKPR
jgi:hypothetical protein